jgi:plasmid stabilization system protein ParE
MVKQVVWNSSAIAGLQSILTYLQEEVSETSAKNFAKKVFERIEVLKKYPEVGRISKKRKEVRLVNIGKRYHMYYRLQGPRLVIVHFFDTRQHPRKNPF